MILFPLFSPSRAKTIAFSSALLIMIGTIISCKTISTSSDPKIVGGELTDLTSQIYRTTVAMELGNMTECTGSLIAADSIITAAHCEIKPGMKIRFGNRNSDWRAYREVQTVTAHACFAVVGSEYDLAVAHFSGGIPEGFGPPIKVIGTADTLMVGEKVTVSGFGNTRAHTQNQDGKLRQVEVEIASTTYSPKMLIAQGVARALGHSPCQGDSGGPLLRKSTSGEYQLIGVIQGAVVVLSDECDDHGTYVNTAYFSKWIHGEISGARTESEMCVNTIDATQLPPPINDNILGPEACRITKDDDPAKIHKKTRLAPISGGNQNAFMGADGGGLLLAPLGNSVTFSAPAAILKMDICRISESGACTLPPVNLSVTGEGKGRRCFQFVSSGTPSAREKFRFKAYGGTQTETEDVVELSVY